ncbi:MAG: hypothetical protein IPL21_12300 [Saprospirales bacterium]|nr:hypothetical protein [Saprospirales bacterium]
MSIKLQKPKNGCCKRIAARSIAKARSNRCLKNEERLKTLEDLKTNISNTESKINNQSLLVDDLS